MRGAWLVGAIVLAAAAPSVALDADVLDVQSATVRFHGRRADLRMEGDLDSLRLPRTFDPATHALRITVAGSPVVDLPAEAARCRVTTNALGDVRVRRKGGLDLRLIPASGRFSVRARGLDGESLRAAGPYGCEVAVAVGAAEASDVPLFVEVSRRRWNFHAAPVTVPRGGTGGGGGGSVPPSSPPPPDTTPLVFTKLSEGQGSAYPGNMSSTTFFVARNAGDLALMWGKHAPGTMPPAVDFATEIVAGWFGGNPSAFHTAQASWVERYGGGIRLHVNLKGSQGVTGNGTHTIVRMTRSDGPITMKGHATFTGPN